MKIEEQKKLNEVKEKMLLEHSEMQAKNDTEKRDGSAKYERDVKSLQDKVEALSKHNTELLDLKRNHEGELKEQTQRIASMQHELEMVTN